MIHYAMLMLAAGIGIPVLAALNGALGRVIASPVLASVILFTVAFLTSLIVLLTQREALSLQTVSTAPRYLMLAGVLIAFYVLSITYVGPRFGIGNAVFFVLLGQLISATAIDHFGLFGAPVSPLTMTRGAGIALMTAGVGLTQFSS
ncbi:transporter family-2 protein [Epibacterium ulvae]|uniref:Transporter family-2 protein n=1 Tax=Epibacterium ulvae TaxID=1156985 RepID=A0A1G5PYS8_9RHOB|nr:DMT family transporter [Epibacterium ulvae]SCZ54446.1 transporter family-2 protein [Epibacterium ulvae]